MLDFKTTLKLSAEYEQDVSEIKHVLKGLAKVQRNEIPGISSCSSVSEKQKSVFNHKSKVSGKASSFERRHRDYGTDLTNHLRKTITTASDNHALQNVQKTLLLPVSYSSCVLIKSA